MIIPPARRTESVQEYYFSRKLKEIAEINKRKAAEGQASVINLGIGAPDGMPPADAILALTESARRKDTHAYQSYVGIEELRKAFAAWYLRYSQALDAIRPLTEDLDILGEYTSSNYDNPSGS